MSRYLKVPQFDGASDTRDRSGSTGSHRSQGSMAGGPAPAGSSRAPSQPAASQGSVSRPPSNAGSSRGPPQGQSTVPLRDPAREKDPLTPQEQHRIALGKLIDLPADAYAHSNGHAFAVRPGLGKVGKPLNLRVNQFRVNGLPNFDVFQYDVSLKIPSSISRDDHSC